MKKGFSAWQVAAAYIGTIIGAGFASGLEVLQFFTRFGPWGLVGLMLVLALFFVFGLIMMELGRALHAQSYEKVIRYTGGKYAGAGIDAIITVSLFTTQAAMLAGTGALFAQEFQVPAMWGAFGMALVMAFTVANGFKGVIQANSLLVPLLLATVIATCVASIFCAPPAFANAAVPSDGSLVGNWLSSAVLYVSCNSVLSISVLAPLGSSASGSKAIRYGALMGGLGLGLGALMIHLAMMAYMPKIAQYEIPMVFIAGSLSKVLRLLYIFALITAIYTTAVGSLYGFAARFANATAHPVWYRIIVVFSAAAALLCSNWGFVNMVKYLYPIKGYIGLLILACLLWSHCRLKRNRTQGG